MKAKIASISFITVLHFFWFTSHAGHIYIPRFQSWVVYSRWCVLHRDIWQGLLHMCFLTVALGTAGVELHTLLLSVNTEVLDVS